MDSFIPTWAYDEPKKKKKRVGAKSSRDKPAKADAENGGEAASAVPVVGASSATEENISMGGMKHRQAATVEEIDDEE